MKKQKKQNEEKKMFEEETYRKQIMLSHGQLGIEVTPKYDTGEPK